jgi:hypothetical protein
MDSMAEIKIEIIFFLLIVCLLYVYLPRTRQLVVAVIMVALATGKNQYYVPTIF